MGLDGRTVAIGVFAVVLALVLGAVAGTQVGALAGALAALAGLGASGCSGRGGGAAATEYRADEEAAGSSPQVRAAEADG